MNVDRLAKRYRGRVTFWGGIDRQRLQNPGTTDEFREAVLEVRRALDFGHGGVIAQCAVEPRRPLADDRHVLRAVACAPADARISGP